MALWRRRRKRRQVRSPARTSTVRQVVYGLLSILIVVVVFVLIWYGTRFPQVTITEITIVGGETISHEAIRVLVEEKLSGSYSMLIPHRFVYLYPHDAIVAAIEEIPRISTVYIEKRTNTHLEVVFDEHVPHALWCLDEHDASQCYFLDSTGYAFAPAPPLSGGAFVRHIVEGSGSLGESQILSENTISIVDRFSEMLYTYAGFRVSQVTYTIDDDVIYRINGSSTLLTTMGMEVEETFENLRSILDSEKFSHLKPGNFNYIDLRFGNRVFVNEEFPTEKENEPAEPAQDGTQGIEEVQETSE